MVGGEIDVSAGRTERNSGTEKFSVKVKGDSQEHDSFTQ